jgi:endo-alpha-N-acetylgalactosaminidase
LVRATAIEANANGTRLELDGGVRIAGGNVQDIVALQVLGGAIMYLSDLSPVSYRFVPYLHVDWPLAQDHCVTGGPLMVGGKRYSKGIGLHSACRVTYKLDGPFQRFEAIIAIDDAARGRGSAVFGVYVERDGKWGEAYKSDIVRGGEPPQAVSLDLRGATGLTLTVDYADRGDELDYADWLDARLTR